jgi:hypothetical protein
MIEPGAPTNSLALRETAPPLTRSWPIDCCSDPALAGFRIGAGQPHVDRDIGSEQKIALL